MGKRKRPRVDDPQEAHYVGPMNSCGHWTEDLRKPIIETANFYTDVGPGHKPLGELVRYVKEDIRCTGGTTTESNTSAPCDGTSYGEGMHYILPQRELIIGPIEAMVNANSFDGLALSCSCDKIVPSILMAAASLDKPCMFLTIDSMLPYEREERTYIAPDLKESIDGRNVDSISEDTFTILRGNICFPHGTCSIYGIANTMRVFPEVIGLAPMDSTAVLYYSAAKYKQARDTGERIVALTEEGVTFSHIVTGNSLINGLRHVSATGGSSNARFRVCTITKTVNLNLDVRWFDEIQKDVPYTVKFKPSSQYSTYDYYKAGGVGAILKGIKDYLNLGEKSATGGTLKEYLDKSNRKVDKAIIHDIDDPLYPGGCFAVLTEDLIPKGCMVKKSDMEPSVFPHRGPAVCFDSEEGLRDYMVHKTIRPGSVLVIHYEGPKGGPRMRKLSIPAAMLMGVRLHTPVAIVTGGRPSDVTRGPCVGHITSEAWEGGPIAAVEDGDIITVDLDNRSVNVELTQEGISDRFKHVRKPDHPARGVVKAFRSMVSEADEGTVWLYRGK